MHVLGSIGLTTVGMEEEETAGKERRRTHSDRVCNLAGPMSSAVAAGRRGLEGALTLWCLVLASRNLFATMTHRRRANSAGEFRVRSERIDVKRSRSSSTFDVRRAMIPMRCVIGVTRLRRLLSAEGSACNERISKSSCCRCARQSSWLLGAYAKVQ